MKFQLEVHQDSASHAAKNFTHFSHSRLLTKTVRDEFHSVTYVVHIGLWLATHLIENSGKVIKTALRMLRLKSLSGISSF